MAETQPKTVLVVEDADNWREIHAYEFGKLGVNVITAATIAEAEAFMKEGGITHIVTDGLEGGWKEVVDAAHQTGISSVIVLSGRSIGDKVLEAGGIYVDKHKVSMGEIDYKDLVK